MLEVVCYCSKGYYVLHYFFSLDDRQTTGQLFSKHGSDGKATLHVSSWQFYYVQMSLSNHAAQKYFKY